MNSTIITVVGNLTADPEMRYTASGVAVARLSIACTPRRLDKTTNAWTDGETTFWSGTVWRSLAENATESLRRGMRVIATGTVRTERWTDKDTGQDRERVVLDIDDVGPSLTWATATVTKAGRRAPAPAPTSAPAAVAHSDEPPF